MLYCIQSLLKQQKRKAEDMNMLKMIVTQSLRGDCCCIVRKVNCDRGKQNFCPFLQQNIYNFGKDGLIVQKITDNYCYL